jgi:hypothetical protein
VLSRIQNLVLKRLLLEVRNYQQALFAMSVPLEQSVLAAASDIENEQQHECELARKQTKGEEVPGLLYAHKSSMHDTHLPLLSAHKV